MVSQIQKLKDSLSQYQKDYETLTGKLPTNFCATPEEFAELEHTLSDRQGPDFVFISPTKIVFKTDIALILVQVTGGEHGRNTTRRSISL